MGVSFVERAKVVGVIRVVLADDHHMFRQGLKVLLASEPDIEVVGEADNGESAIKLIDKDPPDILIVDLMVKGWDGLEIIHHVRNRLHKTEVVVLSEYDNEAFILEVLRAGAKAYVLKVSTSDELIRAVREVAAGRRYLGVPIYERAINVFIEKSEASDFDLYNVLTNREREILHLVAKGLTNNEIANRLVLSPRTVEVHRANIMRKLKLQNHAQLVHFALQRKIPIT